MAFNVTSNFAGKEAGFYISAALKDAKSLDYLTQMNNVRYKSNIQAVNGATLLRDATCDFTDYGTLTMTEKVLEVTPLQINIDLCKQNLVSSWESLQMSGPGAMPPPSFEDYVISYMGEIIADATENSIWGGTTGTSGEFNGFTGYWLLPGTDATVVQDAAAGAYTNANIIASLQGLVDAITGGTANAVLGKDDAYIYMNNKTWQLYIQAISALTGTPWMSMNKDYERVFEGIKIAVVPGMVDNQLVFAQKSNLFFGTDLLSDHTRIGIMDMSQLDGSDNLRLVARYTAGVVAGVGADVVRQS